MSSPHILDGGQTTVIRRWADDLPAGRATPIAAPRTDQERDILELQPSQSVLILPLLDNGSRIGVAVGYARTGESDAALRSLEVLDEPLAVFVLTASSVFVLREQNAAVAADRLALLNRLGRQALADEVVGGSGGLRAVLERASLVSRSDVPVLLFGETGAGKEVIARAIHQSSSRSAGPFIRVNCGAIPPELIDSQLFGHERGSFTGASERRSGWFERAHQGTLFLDEIGELPSPAQVRLLRVLQDGSFERVGGRDTLHVDCRIVAATHRDLPRMVQEHAFREDLWYRLATFPIVIPPLRERLEDLPELSRHFARRAARRFGLAECAPTPADLQLLSAYRWPGNVRELQNVLERAALLGEGRKLEVAAALGNFSAAPIVTPVSPVETVASPDPGADSLDESMRRHIVAALSATRGRIAGPFGAAARLEINPHTLRARMRKLGIDWRQYRLAARRF